MGSIREGRISGKIPEQQQFAVKYPGYPTSLARAIQTLGGEDSISKVHSSDTSYLELHFRPEDPHSHPAFGELHKTSGLLLRISRQTKKAHIENSFSQGDVVGGKHTQKERGNDGHDNEGSLEICANIVSRIHHSYNFDGMADYQYVLPMHANMPNGKKFHHIDTCTEKRGSMELEEVMMIVPPLFSLKDMPEEIVLRSSSRAKTKKKDNQQAEHGTEMDLIPNAGIDFKVEDVPGESTWHQSLVEFSDEWRLYTALAKIFEERPIWTKPMLWGKLVDQNILVTNYQFKRFLSKMAYHFLYGPFRTLWIKKGYDPRKDPESRRYQMVDFRVPRSVRDSFLKAELGNFDKAGYWNALCAFKVVPRNTFSFFELCEFQDDFIQMQISKPPERNTCNEFSGWFRRSTLERIRQHVRLRFVSLIPGDAARALEVLEQKSLERFKSRQDISLITHQSLSLAKDTRDIRFDNTSGFLDIPSHPENVRNKQPTGLNSDEENADLDYEEDGDDDDDDEDDDEEAREAREELDEDEDEDEDDEEDESFEQFLEGHNQGDELEHGSEYPVANIPENFLQALLEKFPVSSEKQKLELPQEFNFGEDETEYSIYEQDDDDEDNDQSMH
ncbi:hypothetical protein O6H91_12G062100 [Diphasiastrum complanatum]|uniref:Uncharacterized protein n=2 Tax=Diphasiastrum complanatum TaxID=34168 RepID=A0ACC2C332_DIPCM|nr:hypothetical protein O6H91_12G062100 [Diphasiastrum complanatum]